MTTRANGNRGKTSRPAIWLSAESERLMAAGEAGCPWPSLPTARYPGRRHNRDKSLVVVRDVGTVSELYQPVQASLPVARDTHPRAG
jgi:hypothetical protein